MTAHIPLHGRSGVVGFVLVDDEDAPAVAGHRWHLQHGYAARKDGGRTVLLHRELAGLRHGSPLQVDHRDRDPLNNTRRNLRAVTPAENLRNRRGWAG